VRATPTFLEVLAFIEFDLRMLKIIIINFINYYNGTQQAVEWSGILTLI
jgi:hypothetical protein